jgi:hypothetical protein
MKKVIYKIGVLAIPVMLVLTAVKVLAAEGDYTFLAPLPGLSTTISGDNILGTYLPAVFNILIGLSAVAAVLMIVIGGFQYMSSDAITGKSAGKERIKNAIYGLVLVIGAWLILYTINPNLLVLNLNLESVTTTSPTGGGALVPTGPVGPAMTQAQIDASNDERLKLATEGIAVNHGPCIGTATTGCTNLNGFAATTESGLKELAQELGCNGKQSSPCLTITGGTEGGHTAGNSHANGTAVDVSQANTALQYYIVQNGGVPVPSSYGPVYTITMKNGQTIKVLQESNPPHLHIAF